MNVYASLVTRRTLVLPVLLVMFFCTLPCQSRALLFPETEFKIFQFPAHMIPRIDGDASDWDIVPDEYRYGNDVLIDVESDVPGHDIPRLTPVDPANTNIQVRVGWVKGLNRLYFLYEAYDDYWYYDTTEAGNDMFEICVDADRSGGDFIFSVFDDDHPERNVLHTSSHGQSYHMFTPAVDKGWAFAWNLPPWINKLPYMNSYSTFDFSHGESGNLVMECWITPFDYVSFDGPDQAVVSNLVENTLIGLAWLTADKDGPEGKTKSLPSLSNDVKMVHNADYLRPFRLMPLEERFLEPIDASYTFTCVGSDRRTVAFTDRSRGEITSWLWDFGDGTTSTEQHPVHTYAELILYTIVVLSIEGPAGSSRYSTSGEVLIR